MEKKTSDTAAHHRPSRLALSASTLSHPSKEVCLITTYLRSPLQNKSAEDFLRYEPLLRLLSTLRYHAYTIWLFTYSSHKDTVYPSVAFAVSTSLSTCFQFPPAPTSYQTLLISTLLSTFQTWLALLLFSLHNQHNPSAVLEDTLNKPWRPIPSGRITPSQTRILLLAYYPLWFGVSFHLGCGLPCVAMTVLTWLYCEMGGCGDYGGVVRNGLNALGFGCFFGGGLGAFLFALSGSRPLGVGGDDYGLSLSLGLGLGLGSGWELYTGKVGMWIAIMRALIFTTMHAQDFRDEEGDTAARGGGPPGTVQAALGDKGSRWLVVIAAAAWSVVVPWVLGLGMVVTAGLLGVAGVLAWAMLRCLWDGRRTVEGDVWAYKVWIVWFVAVILAPLLQNGVDLAEGWMLD